VVAKKRVNIIKIRKINLDQPTNFQARDRESRAHESWWLSWAFLLPKSLIFLFEVFN
jgi:hypothetical protein